MKKILLIAALLVAVVLAVLAFGASKLGPLVKTAVNTYGPQLTKTEVSLGAVNISLLSGTVEIKDFSLGNPQGFASPSAVTVGSIFIDIDKKSITGDTIVIHTIEVTAPEITYEKKRGTDNLQSIINNVNRSAEPAEARKESAEQKGGSSGPGKKIMIENFILKQGTVTLASLLAGGEVVSARLSDIHLKNIGGQGASPQQVFGEIFKAVHAQITSAAVKDAFSQRLKGLGKSLDAIEEDVKKQAGSIKETVKGLFGK